MVEYIAFLFAQVPPSALTHLRIGCPSLVPITPSLLEKSSVVHAFVYRYPELFPTRQLIIHFPCCADVPFFRASPNATESGKG